jgi:hypothetical protein
MMEKPKRKYGDQSLFGRLVDKHISFCTTTPLEECVMLLKARSQKPGLGTYLNHESYIPISVKQIDLDNYSFEMEKIDGLWPCANLHGSLERMGEETLVRATATMIGINMIVLIWGLLIGAGIFILADVPLGIVVPSICGLALVYCFIIWAARDELCDRLVQIVGKRIKYQ